MPIEPQLSGNRRAGEISIGEAGASYIKIATDIREHHDSLVGMTGVTHEQISTNLQGIGVQLALEAGAVHAKRSRDLPAVQIHILLEVGHHVRRFGRHAQGAANLQ